MEQTFFGMSLSVLLMGIIWSLALGFTAGNYACSLVYRLPRGKGILEKKPYCGSCSTMLATKDLFPVVSALLLRHKCRYCAAPIPMTHFWTEIALGVLFCACFIAFGFSERYFLVAALGSFLVTLASIHHNDNLVEKRVLVAVIVAGMLLRTLLDGSIFGFCFGALYGVVIGAIVWRKQIVKEGHIYKLPLNALLLGIGSLIAGDKAFLWFILLFAAFGAVFWLLDMLAKREKRMTVMLPFSLAVITVCFM